MRLREEADVGVPFGQKSDNGYGNWHIKFEPATFVKAASPINLLIVLCVDQELPSDFTDTRRVLMMVLGR